MTPLNATTPSKISGENPDPGEKSCLNRAGPTDICKAKYPHFIEGGIKKGTNCISVMDYTTLVLTSGICGSMANRHAEKNFTRVQSPPVTLTINRLI